jgi:nitric oxide reductase NorD protein
VSALEPDGTTRLGAAIRHATAELARRAVGHRLLLLLSDGKPNDRDRYYVDYGVEDSRRAVVEARSIGVHPYCLTVDRREPEEYMTDIFGKTGYLALREPEHLPRALVRAVQRLLG